MATAKTKKNTPKEKKQATVKSRVVPNGMEAVVYDQKGKETGKINLPGNVFGLSWNADLVHQVITSMESSARYGTANTKGRAEIRGGGKKPWRQKGTGRARHGSSRSPIWRGGGITHGPSVEKNYDRKVNRKMKVKALYTILSRKFKEGEIVFVNTLSLPEIKTKGAAEIMGSLFKDISKKKKNALLVALPKKDLHIEKSFRNFGNVEIIETRNLNPVTLATYKEVAIVNPEESLKSFEGKI